jgi:hypothetical protein
MLYKLPGFDTLRDMALRDPASLERLRIQLSDQIIQDAPPSYRRKLRGLQFRIDMEIRRARSQMAACIAISGMMHDAFDKLRQALGEVMGDTQPHSAEPAQGSVTLTHPRSAKVLPFRHKA